MADNKDTIYIDVDDEITAIIEKVRSSEQKIVALVLPKRASVLQSIVNMKLLKRSAENAKKSLVLITTEAGLLPLAGSVGLYVARNLQSKPAIPTVADVTDSADAEDDDEDVEFDPAQAATQSVGDLAVSSSVPLVGQSAAASDAIETLELDDDATAAEEADAVTEPGKKPKKEKKPKKDKHLLVPNFESFRKKLLLAVPLLILVIVGLVIAATALPKAEITVVTDTTNVNSNVAFSIDTALKTANLDKKALPAQMQKVDKAGSQQVATTGKKNNGTPATGSITVSSCVAGFNAPDSIPAGTAVTANGFTYVTQAETDFSNSGTPKGTCIAYSGAGSTSITAQAGGAQYNTASGTTFKVYGRSDVAASGSASGGTDNIVQVVSQADIDSATQKITASNSDTVKQQLEQQFKQLGMFAIVATFNAGTPNTTVSSKVGDEASTVSVSQTTTYTMFGIRDPELKALVDADIKDKIDPQKQSILSEGLDKASFKVNSATATSAQIAMSTVATAGPDLKADQLKTQLAGMKKGEITDTLKNDPGVSDVQVKLSPFWVTSVPKKADKVTITFQKAE